MACARSIAIGAVAAAAVACGGAAGAPSFVLSPSSTAAPTTVAVTTPSSPSPAAATAAASTAPRAATAAPEMPAAAATQAELQTITLSEWKVGMSATTLKAGRVFFAIGNSGKAPHELLVFSSTLDPSRYPLDKTGNIIEDGPGITLLSDGENLDPGGAQAREVDLNTPGTYLFVCNIPGHYKLGMHAVVTVTR